MLLQVQDPALLDLYASLLSPEEQQHAKAATSQAARKERLLARALQRSVLSRYCSDCWTPNNLNFKRNPAGKPELCWAEGTPDAPQPLHFNLSHTSTAMGIVIGANRLVGLDVEESSRLTRQDPLKLARRRFASAEVAQLQGIEYAEERAKRFVQLWTLKEAYVKALGRGISASPGLKGFSIDISGNRDAQHLASDWLVSPGQNEILLNNVLVIQCLQGLGDLQSKAQAQMEAWGSMTFAFR
eukprot:jgi/Astpho2/5347/Aster-x1290